MSVGEWEEGHGAPQNNQQNCLSWLTDFVGCLNRNVLGFEGSLFCSSELQLLLVIVTVNCSDKVLVCLFAAEMFSYQVASKF